ncbi:MULTISPECIES: DUF4349 domain-containing protein [unclassified Leptolyngbya]|uniref:DUF4349 domain-containing protein n=1 Tax=unclassified Leptolyngbya TaxID=2650499 RepID=UPI001689AE53|nr:MULTISPECIES: DUF4349 domain-containing protein [unclassified Leptolyngbya]MBD1910233.1 DUF4349 domain-containing protein [Leptolyngbya sp. FACHB-8]MBD2155904.1 DUF4349 domain-containing protein [Leptolyngbya sp. FACHB-16]
MRHPLHLSSATVWLTLLLSTVLASCASAPMNTTSESRAEPASAPMPAPVAEGGLAQMATDAKAAPPPPSGGATVPQAELKMVRTAQMRLDVESVSEALEKMEAIARQHQGDIIGLQEQVPQDRGERHTATLTLRVPQAQLDKALDALTPLGTVQNQSITAEDVSTQLVDYQARLKNLRQTEEMLTNIMKRAGDMADVLRVAQEISNVRQSIEMLDAQLTNLQNQVAYSTITVTVQETVPTLGTQQPVGEAIANTWQQATHSVGAFTVFLLKFLTWLAAYSPYLFLILLAAWFYRHQRQGSTTLRPPTDSPEG